MAYVALPEYRPGGEINFGPVNQAFAAITQQNNADRQYGLQQRQMDTQDSERTYQHGRDAKQDSRVALADWGKAALAIGQLEGPQRAAAWQAKLAEHQRAFPGQTLTPEEMDPVTGPKLMAAQAGLYNDPRDSQAKDLELRKTQAQIDALNAKQDDPVQKLLLQRLMPQPAAPAGQPRAQQAPGVIPQSYDPGTDAGGLQLVGDTSQPQQGGPPAPQMSVPDQIDTPFGRMSRQDAKELGGTMLLSPKYAAAGKAMIDAAAASDGAPLGKAVTNQLEERTVNAASQLGRLDQIAKQFNPQFLEIPTRLKMLGASWSAKLGQQLGGRLNPQDQESLRQYAAFRARTVDNLNQNLKEMSGAAVTPQEYERIQATQPAAGTGIFDGDDPVSFKAKLDSSTQLQRSAIARLNYMRSKGLNFDRTNIDQFLALDDVPAAIDQRGAEIEQQLRQRSPNADPMSIQKATRQQLKREFGI